MALLSYACCSRSRPVNDGQTSTLHTLQRRHFFQRIRETDKLREASMAFATSSPRSAFGNKLACGKAAACAGSPVRSASLPPGWHSPVNQLPGGHQSVNVASLNRPRHCARADSLRPSNQFSHTEWRSADNRAAVSRAAHARCLTTT